MAFRLNFIGFLLVLVVLTLNLLLVRSFRCVYCKFKLGVNCSFLVQLYQRIPKIFNGVEVFRIGPIIAIRCLTRVYVVWSKLTDGYPTTN